MLNPSQIVETVRRRAKTTLTSARLQTFPVVVRKTWAKVREENLSYGKDEQLLQLLSSVRATAPSGALIIEAGCARGGSSILMCALKSRDRPLKVYDVFDMIPPPTDLDGQDMKKRYAEITSGEAVGLGGTKYYLYESDLRAVVEGNFGRLGFPIEHHNVQLIKGKAQDTLAVTEPVALAHIDVDWYEPVTACLERVMPNLIVGGSVAVHAYLDWSGARKAVDDYFAKHGSAGLKFDTSAGHMFITRMSGA
jgi:asparagine synthase (glutamine-hydrolysing)